MFINELKEYIKKNPRVSILELTKVFSLEADQIRVFLDRWVALGKLDKFVPKLICGNGTCGCDSCILLAMEIYTWK